MRPRFSQSLRHAGLLAAISCSSVSACVYDADERCGQNQDYVDGTCLCSPGYGFDEETRRCFACGDNEETVDNLCVCLDGYTRNASGVCDNMPPGLGVTCGDSDPCATAPYTTCIEEEGRAPYCSNVDCATNDDCQGGYRCDTRGAQAFCAMPPTGLGQSCSSPADCADTEATWCDTYQTQVCHVGGCSLTDDDCFVGAHCCDMSAYTAYGVPETLCVEGDCP